MGEVAKIKIITSENKTMEDIIIIKTRIDITIITKVAKVPKTTRRCFADILKEREVANMETNAVMHMDNKI